MSLLNAPLTIIVATTPGGGIGCNGTLPWPPLKSEMAYFARVTRRCPPGMINAVLMGRKTWESIPEKFRPLRGRVNVVISRRPDALGFGDAKRGREEGKDGKEEGPLAARSLTDALRLLGEGGHRFQDGERSEGKTVDLTPGSAPDSQQQQQQPGGRLLNRVFVIGGAEIYRAALEELPGAERVLRTRVLNDFPCDVFFPLKFGTEGSVSDGKDAGAGQREEGVEDSGCDAGGVWMKSSKEELDAWTGEEVPSGIQREGGVEWEFEMWEKKKKKPESGT